MEPLIALFGVTAALRIAGALGVRKLRNWRIPLRGGVSVMFLLTGGAHFVGLREMMIAMVPPALPAPELLVTVTGVLELAGAVGLWVRPTAAWAATGLAAMLVGMFPANVHHALSGQDLAWIDTLGPRTVLQVVFLAAVGGLAVLEWRTRRQAAVITSADPVPVGTPAA